MKSKKTISFVKVLLLATPMMLTSCNSTPAHVHTYDDVPEVAATCTETGVEEHYVCPSCKKVFDMDKKEVTEEDLVIEALGHDMTKHAAVAGADCQHEGTIEYYSCSRCDKNFKDVAGKTEVTSLSDGNVGPHSYVKHDGKAPTCTDEGNGEYYTCSVEGCDKMFDEEGEEITEIPTIPALDHDLALKYDDDYHWYACQREGCDYIEGKTTHNYSANPDKIGSRICTVAEGVTHEGSAMTMDDVDLTKNSYGVKFMNGDSDVGGWPATSQATKLVVGKDSIAVEGYGFSDLSVYMPKVDYTKIESLTFDVVLKQAGGATYGNKHVKFNGVIEEYSNGGDYAGTLTIGESATHPKGEVWVSLTVAHYPNLFEMQITDEDIINGNASYVFTWCANVNAGGYSAIQFNNMSLTYKYGNQASRLANLGFAFKGYSFNDWGHMNSQCLYFNSDTVDCNSTLSLPFVSSSCNRVTSTEVWGNLYNKEISLGFDSDHLYTTTASVETVRFIVSPAATGYHVVIEVYQLNKEQWSTMIEASDFTGKTPVFSAESDVASLTDCVVFNVMRYRAVGFKLGTVSLVD